MSTPEQEEIDAIKVEIEKYQNRLDDATTPDLVTVWAGLITAKQNTLTELIKAQNAAISAAAVGASGEHLLPSV